MRRWELDPEPDSFALVLETERGIVGYTHVFARRLRLDGAPRPCAGIGNVAISPGHRGQGHAQRLLRGCLDQARERGFEVALLHTHIQRLYEGLGFVTIPSFEVALEAGSGEGWFEAAAPDEADIVLYRDQAAWRPGAIVRSHDYWAARQGWLQPEGWRLLRHREADGYCYLRSWGEGGIVDEAVGGCAARLEKEAPAPGRWRRRLPRSLASARPQLPPRDSVAMARALAPGISLASLSSEGAVLWLTDEF